jgi:hypothetical protein
MASSRPTGGVAMSRHVDASALSSSSSSAPGPELFCDPADGNGVEMPVADDEDEGVEVCLISRSSSDIRSRTVSGTLEDDDEDEEDDEEEEERPLPDREPEPGPPPGPRPSVRLRQKSVP